MTEAVVNCSTSGTKSTTAILVDYLMDYVKAAGGDVYRVLLSDAVAIEFIRSAIGRVVLYVFHDGRVRLVFNSGIFSEGAREWSLSDPTSIEDIEQALISVVDGQRRMVRYGG